MNSDNHPATYGYQPRAATPFFQTKPPVQEDTLTARLLDIERKTFSVALKDNPRGRFLRITEQSGTNRATIIIPATGLKEFQRLLAEMVQADADLQQKNPGESQRQD